MNNKANETVEAVQATDVSDKNPALKWYVVHTYSGHENRAKKGLEERIKQYGLEQKFGEILLPSETVEEVKSGVKRSQSRKCFPGYLLVEMELDDASWHLVKNTSRITGFVGDAKKPPSLSKKEVERLRSMVEGAPKTRTRMDYSVGDRVRVAEGPFANFNGDVEEVKPDKQKLRVLVSIFGRSTPVELDYAQVEKIA